MSTTNNYFRPKRHYRSVFREGKYLLNTEATELQLEMMDRLKEQINLIYGPNFSIQDGMLVEADTVVGRVIIRPGHSYIDGYPVDFNSGSDPLVSLGVSPTEFTSADFIKVDKTPSEAGGIALQLGGGTPIDAGTYLIVLELKEELITAAQDPYLRSANLSESTADRHRLIVDVHLIPKFISNLEVNGPNIAVSPIPYRGSAAYNFTDYIDITQSGSTYSLVSATAITGAEAIDGRNVELQFNNGNGTATAAFPTSNSDIREFIHGTLIDSNGTEFHISNMFVTPGNATRVTMQLDLEKARPVDLTTWQSTPVIVSGRPYRMVKRSLYVTSSSQLPEGKRFYPVSEIVWNGSTVSASDLMDLRPKALARDGVLDLIRNQGLTLTSEGALYWNQASGGELVWSDALVIQSAFEGFDWTIAAGNSVSLFGGLAVNEVLYVSLDDQPVGGTLALKKGVRGVGELAQDALRASDVFWVAKRLSDNRIYFNGGLTLNDKQSKFFYDVPDYELLPQDILTLGYSALFDDTLDDSSAFDDTASSGEFFASSYMVEYSNRVITVAGNDITLASGTSFTLSVGDVITQGTALATITVVTSPTLVTVDNGALLTTATSAIISQVVQTLDLRTLDDGGGSVEQITAYLNTPVSKVLMRYDDNIIQSIGNSPRVAYSVTANAGTDWTAANVRPDALSDTVTEVIPTTAGSDVRIRFFSNVTAGDGTSILESFRVFMHNRSFVGTLIGTLIGTGGAAGARALEFRVFGDIENPNLAPTGAPTYNVAELEMTSGILVIENGQIGTFNIHIVSYDTDGTNPVVHIMENVVLASAGSSVISMSFANTTIPAGKVVKLLTQYVSGTKTSNVAVVLS